MPSFRRAVAIPALAAAVAAAALSATAAPAAADNASTLTVVGTSDVYDSFLVQNVIKPGFEAYDPGVTLNYISKGTGAAITYAETGAASAMLVHAASLENQYVAAGYSLEPYGRAVFWGDYVLLGPASDPARVLNGSSHDIVSAFQKVAAAGAKGKATFVSRGGTPGTTVQEHAIWALTTGVPLCQVSDTNGGGEAPSTVSGPCPIPPTNPSWYQTTGLTQGPNILAGDACNYPSAPNGNNCYVFTDRGTYQYLKSQGSIANLQFVVRGNSGAPASQANLLVNSFHAYGVNPAKFADNPNVQINSAAAQQFLNYLTTPAAQAAVGNYLANVSGGSPFIPDAAPVVASKVIYDANPASSATIRGAISNAVPGTPPLSGVQVTLTYTPAVAPDQPTTLQATTDSLGKFAFSYRPTASGSFTLSTPPITKIEYPDLDPPFGDMLVASSKPIGQPFSVAGAITITKVTGGKGVITGSATLAPTDTYQVGSLDLYAAPATDPPSALTLQASLPIPVGKKSLTFRYQVPAGTYQIQLHYRNDGVIDEGMSDVKTVTVS